MVLIKLRAFSINNSDGVCCYIQAEMESVLVKIQAFTIFLSPYYSSLFLLKLLVFTINGSDKSVTELAFISMLC